MSDQPLRPAHGALRAALCLHMAAAGLAMLAQPELALVIALLMAASWAWVRRSPVLGFGTTAFDGLHLGADGELRIRIGGTWRDAELRAGSRAIGPWLLVGVTAGERAGWRLIEPAALDGESLRRLRVVIHAVRGAGGQDARLSR